MCNTYLSDGSRVRSKKLMNCRQNRKLSFKNTEGIMPKQAMKYQTSKYRFIFPLPRVRCMQT
jgi:hypothetical protein